MRITDVDVIVPAADEQDEIGGCLDALAVALGELRRGTGQRVRARVTVVLDACTDATAEVVASRPGVQTVTSRARCVGAARRLGADHALARPGDLGSRWLALTDADCRVPADWLVRMLAEAESGADLVLGTVRPGTGLRVAVEAAWHAAHHADDGHPHVHGANLGVSALAYRRIGGFRDLAVHEDVDLVQRAERAGLCLRRSGGLAVTTSARTAGRTGAGFAAYLSDLDATVSAGLSDAV